MRSTIPPISTFPLIVAAVTGLVAAAQSTLPLSSRPVHHDEALQVMSKGQFAEARQIVLALIGNAEHAGSPLGYQAGLWHLLGVANGKLGLHDEAKAALNRGLQALDQSQQTAPELRIALLVELADVNLNQGNLEDANAALRRALEIASKDLPSRHPRLASVHHSLGILFWMQGQLSRAEKAFRQSLTIFEESQGPDHPDTAAMLGGLAGLLAMTGRQAEAIPLLERSKTTIERIYGPLHPDTIAATYALAAAIAESAPARSELMLRQAIANWRASQPDRHPNMIKFLSALAISCRAQGDYREAAILSEQALQMSKDIFGLEHPNVVAQMYKHALLLRASQRRREATALKREADRIRALKGYNEVGRHQIDILAPH